MQRLLKILLVLLLLPYLLAVVYAFVPPVSTLMLARTVTFKPVSRQYVPLEKISPQLVIAVLAAEDGDFCNHFGFDFRQIGRAVDEAVDGNRPIKGASTITQQTAKNLFLWNGRSWLRKLLEAPLALWMEIIWPKRRILEAYLNVAEWDEGVFGAEAAARHHFRVSAADLTSRQAAALAASLPNPVRRDAGRPGPATKALAMNIERRMARGVGTSCLR